MLPTAEPGVFRLLHPLSYPDADAAGLVRPTSVLNLLQIQAGDHTTSRGFDYRLNRDAGVFWVLSRLTVRFDHWPTWPCRLWVDTWARSTKAVFALRDFRFGSENGPVIGRASSAWVLLKDRRPQRPEPWVAIYDRVRPEEPLAEMPEALDPVQQSGDRRPVRADWNDVDMNGHVNNVSAIGWCLAQHGYDFLAQWRPRTLEANFLAEMFCDQEFDVHWVEAPGNEGDSAKTFDYEVIRPSDGGVTLRLRVGFAPVGAGQGTEPR